MFRHFRVNGALALLLVAACNFSNDVVSVSDGSADGYMRANLEGRVFDASDVRATIKDGVFTLIGEEPGHRKVSIELYGVTTTMALPRTFHTFPSTADSVGFAQFTEPQGVTFVYYTTVLTGGRGTIVITSLADGHVSGTFSLTTARTPGSPGALAFVNISSGEFSAKY